MNPAKEKESTPINPTGQRGGKRPGAGRKAGVRNKRTAELLDAVQAQGVTPLDFMLNIMRSDPPKGAGTIELLAHRERQFEAAKAAAPYVHAKLQNVEMNANVTNHEATLDELE